MLEVHETYDILKKGITGTPASNQHVSNHASCMLCLLAVVVLLAGKHRMWASVAWGGLSVVAGSLVAHRGLGAG
jgi:hypothetical protein